MEMTKKPAASKPKPSPFSSSAERDGLERAWQSSSTATASSSQINSAIPTVTAVPVAADAFYENDAAPAMAVATMANLPPPPPGAYASAYASNRTANAQRTAAKKSEKSESYTDDDDVIVKPEPLLYGDGSGHPTAPPDLPANKLPTFKSNLPTSHQQSTSSKLRAANVKGAMSSEEEMAEVARAHRRALENQAEDGRGVRVTTANAKAYQKVGRWDEGLTVDDWPDYRIGTESVGGERQNDGKGEEGEDLYGKKEHKGKGGYDVNEYDIQEYDTFDYDVTEYKSIYD